MLAQDSTFMQDGIITAVARCPITIQRRPAVDIDIKKAGAIMKFYKDAIASVLRL